MALSVESRSPFDKTPLQNQTSSGLTCMENDTPGFPTNYRSTYNYNIDKRTTSLQDPYRIIDIAHIVSDPSRPEIKGRLSISISPGKKDSKWNRSIQSDLDAIKINGIQVIVCLLEWSELRMLGISDYPRRAQELGFLFYHMPIRDRGTPHQSEINILVPLLVKHLALGQNVLVHCRGGLGRAGTVCACCLGHFGYEGTLAIDTVRKFRPGAIQTTTQAECVIQYCQGLSTHRI
jgi:protein-tyrosine phosphatase